MVSKVCGIMTCNVFYDEGSSASGEGKSFEENDEHDSLSLIKRGLLCNKSHDNSSSYGSYYVED